MKILINRSQTIILKCIFFNMVQKLIINKVKSLEKANILFIVFKKLIVKRE